MKKARFPRAFFISIIPSNPLHPLSGGLPEPAALRLQNPGGSAASMSYDISLTLRRGA